MYIQNRFIRLQKVDRDNQVPAVTILHDNISFSYSVRQYLIPKLRDSVDTGSRYDGRHCEYADSF